MHLLPLYSILEMCYPKETSSNTNNTPFTESIQAAAKTS
jgi:hypothetical protein